MARRDSDMIVLMEVFSKLPAWLCLALAVGSWFGFQSLHRSYSAPPPASAELATRLVQSILATLFMVAQYLAPLVLTLSAMLGAWRRAARRGRLTAAAKDPTTAVEAMSWQQFEQLLADAFRGQGFTVSEGPGSRDGGVDLRLHRDAQLHLVQAKHWKTRSVGVKVARELYGVMAAEGAAAGMIVSSGDFTPEAREFARDKPLTLIDRAALDALLQGRPPSPVCPRCGGAMVRRQARRGPQTGSSFWGCSDFPRCRGTV